MQISFASRTARATLIVFQILTAKEGTEMSITKKDKAKQDAKKAAERAYRQATLKACGYAALKNKHRKSLRPEMPDLKVKQVTPTSDRVFFWCRVIEIQARLVEGLFVRDADMSFLKRTLAERGQRL